MIDKATVMNVVGVVDPALKPYVNITHLTPTGIQLDLPAYILSNQTDFSRQVSSLLGVSHDVVATNVSLQPYQTQLEKKRLPGIKNIIAVGSGKGGVGKSTVSIQLALALNRLGAKTAVLDADIYGPSVPRMLGLEHSIETQDGQFLPVDCHGLSAISIGWLVDPKEPTIWRGPILSRVLMQLFEKTRWPELDFLIVDLPPGTGDIHLTIAQKVPISGAVIVSTPQAIAMDDAIKAKHMFDKLGITNLGWVKNMSGFICDHCASETEILPTNHQTALSQDNCLGSIPMIPNICYAADNGQLHELDQRVTDYYTTIAIEMQRALVDSSVVSTQPCWPKVEIQNRR